MSKHTPGPWTAYRNKSFWQFNDANGDQLGDVCASHINANCQMSDECEPTAEANARLIAAAPEMLYALKRAAINLTELIELNGDLADSATLALIHSVIAKAEGRT